MMADKEEKAHIITAFNFEGTAEVAVSYQQERSEVRLYRMKGGGSDVVPNLTQEPISSLIFTRR